MIALPLAASAALGVLAEEVRFAGGRAWIVGGAVRDAMLGRPPLDLDVAVEGERGTVGRAARVLGAVGWVAEAVHDRFETATVRGPHGVKADLAATRSERYPEPGLLPVVTPGVTIEEDLGRRDFPIHAMAVPLGPDGPGPFLLDPWGGETDLRRRVIRLLHGRSLADDPTRVFRAARYAARLGFDLDERFPDALAAAAESGAFARISGDRLRRAFSEVLAEENRAVALSILDRLGVPSLVVEGWEIGAVTVSSFDAPVPPDESWGALLEREPAESRERIAGRLNFSRALRRVSGCRR